MKGSDIIKKALEDGRLHDEAQGFKRRLAKILYNENQNVFDSVEQVRTSIRYYTGNQGEEHRNNLSDNTHVDTNPYIYKIPNYTWSKPKATFIPKASNVIGILTDVHVPFHDQRTIDIAFNHFIDEEIDALVLNGDIMDCASLSKYEKDMNTPSLEFELDALYEFLSMTKDAFPNIPIYYKIGNHEHRFERQFYNKNPDIAKNSDYTFFDMSSIREFGMTGIDSNGWIETYSGVKIYHGHELNCGAIVNPAKSVFNKTYGVDNIIFGHLHVTDTWDRANCKKVYCVGCACELNATYDSSSRYRWNNGYGILYSADTFEFRNIKI